MMAAAKAEGLILRGLSHRLLDGHRDPHRSG